MFFCLSTQCVAFPTTNPDSYNLCVFSQCSRVECQKNYIYTIYIYLLGTQLSGARVRLVRTMDDGDDRRQRPHSSWRRATTTPTTRAGYEVWPSAPLKPSKFAGLLRAERTGSNVAQATTARCTKCASPSSSFVATTMRRPIVLCGRHSHNAETNGEPLPTYTCAAKLYSHINLAATRYIWYICCANVCTIFPCQEPSIFQL